MLIEIEEKTTQIYMNNCGIIAVGSEKMLEKLQEGKPLFFTISIADFKELFKKNIKKDSGYKFEGCNSHFIPNSYLEVHIEKDISFLTDSVAIQFRKRKDDRGINIFACKPENEICHRLTFEKFPDKEEYFNELYLKTKEYRDDLFLAVRPV